MFYLMVFFSVCMLTVCLYVSTVLCTSLLITEKNYMHYRK